MPYERIKLHNMDGEHVEDIAIPVMNPRPPVIYWGFELYMDRKAGNYDAFTPYSPDPNKADPRTHDDLLTDRP